jgi:hypothetical protein
MSARNHARLLALGSILSLLSFSVFGGTMIKMNLEQLALNSYMIVVGDVLSMQTSHRWSHLGLRQCTFRVEQFVGGSNVKEGEAILIDAIRQGAANSLKTNVAASLEVGERVVLFLYKSLAGHFEILGSFQGKFLVTNGIIEGTSVPVGDFVEMIKGYRTGSRNLVGLGIGVESSLAKTTRTSCSGDGVNYQWGDPGNGVRWNDSYVTPTVYINKAQAVGLDGLRLTFTQAKKGIERGFQSWANVSNCYIGVPTFVDDSTKDINLNSECVIKWDTIPAGFGGVTTAWRYDDFAEGSYCKAADIMLPSRNRRIFGGVEYDLGPEKWNWDPDNANYPPDSCNCWSPSDCNISLDVFNVAIHEIGHFWGLGHVSDPNATMYGYSSSCGVTYRALMDGDKASIVSLYRIVSGSISGNVTWCSGDGSDNWELPPAQIHVVGNTTVSSGATLSIPLGGIVKFSSGVSLTLNGTLDAVDATFTSASPSSTWSGILFSGSGANNSSLENCTVEHVLTYGGSAVTVDGATGVQIHHCTISNNGNYGTSGISFIDAGSPEVYHCTINSNGSYGVKFQNTNGNIWSNTITSNSTGGVYCYNSASPSFGKSGYYYSTSSGNNTITGGSYGVYASSSSSPYVGSQSTSSYGYNRITSASSAAVYAGSYCNPLAEQNWWGSSPPDTGWFQLSDGSSSIDWNPYLTSDPGPAPKIMTTGEQTLGLLTKKEFGPVGTGNDWRGTLRLAIEDRVNERYQEAKQLLEGLAEASPTSDAALYAAGELLQVYRATLDDDILNFTQSSLVQKRPTDPAVQLILAKMLSLKTEKSEAINLLTAVAADNPNTELEKLALLDLFHLYYSTPQYASSLGAPLAILLKNDGDDPNVREALWLSRIRGGTVSQQKSQLAASTGGQISNGLRLENYPNPFNPSTVIGFSMAEEGLVTLKVYDLLGREVATILNSQQIAGSHEVRFDASHLPSGMYVYKLEAAGRSIVQKMVLVR